MSNTVPAHKFHAMTPDQRAALALTRKVQVNRAKQYHELTYRIPQRRAELQNRNAA